MTNSPSPCTTSPVSLKASKNQATAVAALSSAMISCPDSGFMTTLAGPSFGSFSHSPVCSL